MTSKIVIIVLSVIVIALLATYLYFTISTAETVSNASNAVSNASNAVSNASNAVSNASAVSQPQVQVQPQPQPQPQPQTQPLPTNPGTAANKTQSGVSYSFIPTGQCTQSTGSGMFPPGTTVDKAIDMCKSMDGTEGHKLGGIGKCLGIESYGLKLSDGNIYPFSGCLEIGTEGGSGVYKVL